MRLRYQLVVAVLVITLMVSCFLAGRQFESVAAVSPNSDREARRFIGALMGVGGDAGGASGIEDVSLAPLEGFQEVLSHLRRQYVAPIGDETDLTYGAIRGMLAVLRNAPYDDRYSRFLDPEEYRSFLQENEGHFGGIGAEITLREVDLEPSASADLAGVTCPVCGSDVTATKRTQVVVIAPLPNSPAERAGLQPGDHIIRVDDVLTAGMGLGEVVRRIKGPPGTVLTMIIAREGEPHTIEVKITRAIIQVQSVEHEMLSDGIAYLRLSTFNETTPELVRDALQELRADGMRGLLLDLRNNAGGGLEVCVRVSSEFIGTGPVVYIQERGRAREPRNATGDNGPFDLPLVVLTNLGSASAAEILAGAIKDKEIGTLVGTKTFGKGLVQTVIPLRDGSALALTTARYLTPNLSDIDRKGIEPDKVVEQPRNEYIPPLSEDDQQARAALQVLRGKMGLQVKRAA